MQLTDFKVLTFDCYGTLIDWESGILQAVAPWRDRAGVSASDDDMLEAFGRHESAQQRETPGMCYPELLVRVLKRIGGEWGAAVSDAEAESFGRSVPDWPAFEDSAGSLAYLKQHYKLVILSNIDRESFAASSEKLGVVFDAIYTAQDIGSYKPSPQNFAYMLERLEADGVAKADILHTAQSLFHDHVPAQAIGLATNWIDRRAGKSGGGATATPGGDIRTDFRFESMAAFVDAHREALGA